MCRRDLMWFLYVILFGIKRFIKQRPSIALLEMETVNRFLSRIINMNVKFYDYDFIRNLCRQIACFCSPLPPSPPVAGEFEPYKYDPEVVSWSTSVFNDSSKTEGPRRSIKKKQTWPWCCESSMACQENILHSSRPVAASHFADRVAVAVTATPLIVSADTSAVFPFRWLVLFWWGYFI